VPGDQWALRPDLILYSGGVNRPAIEKVLQKFATREGISVTTTYNGCGILCAAMKTMGDSSNPKFPDVYYACDVCFVPPVAEQFPEAVMLTEAEIVIAVPKGNPQNIRTLADLARPGLRVGLVQRGAVHAGLSDELDAEVDEPVGEREQERLVTSADGRFPGEPDAHGIARRGGGVSDQHPVCPSAFRRRAAACRQIEGGATLCRAA
jgi:accessory colonization factor AcfC